MFDKLLARVEFTTDVVVGNNNRSDKPSFAPNTKIAYNPALIPILEKQHQNLLYLYMKATRAAKAKLGNRTRELLSQFKDSYVDHVLKKNTSLYIYLEHSESTETPDESIHLIKVELDKISREVIQFLNYAVGDSSPINDEFLQRMSDVFRIIRKRIMYEERHVFPTYVRK